MTSLNTLHAVHIPMASNNLTKPILPCNKKEKISYINLFAYN
jgi:hypothetical protein